MIKSVVSNVFRSGICAALMFTASASGASDVLRTKIPTPRPAVLALEAPTPARLVEKSALSGIVGFVVADAKTGAVLESMNGQRALPPASVAKSLTTLFALDRLGAGYQFQTRLVATGPVVDGRINGDLVLVGGGDPTLSTDALALMARDLRAAGVNSISGQFRTYDGALPYVKAIDAGQPDHVGYNPAVSGLNVNFNRVHFEWKRAGSGGYGITMEGRSDAHRPAVDMATMRVVNRQAPVYTYASKAGVDTWTVASGALGNGGSRWLPVRQPAAYAGDVFRSLARRNGVTLPRARATDAAPRGTVLVTHRSVPLERVLRDMMRFSTNLTAEAVGMTASGGSGLRASATGMNTYLATRYGVAAKLVDHSGLGDKSQITAQDMAKILVGAYGAGQLAPLMKPVEIRHPDGKTMTDQPAHVRAKTGSLNFVSALSGYMTMPNGRDVVFAIFTADERIRRQIARADRERPQGGRTWAGKSRQLQHDLLARWAQVYGR